MSYSTALRSAASERDDVDAACKRLMDMALDAGGRDNTTILLCAIEEKPVGAGRRLTRFVKGLFSRGRN